PGQRPLRPVGVSGGRRSSDRAGDGPRQRRGDPGHREAAALHLRLWARHLYLPDHRLQLRGQSRPAWPDHGPRGGGSDGRTDRGRLRAGSRGLDADGAAEAGIHAGRLLWSVDDYAHCGRVAGHRAAMVDAPCGGRAGRRGSRSVCRNSRRARTAAPRARPTERLTMLELIVGIVLATGAMFFVLRPIIAPTSEPDSGDTTDEGLDPDDDM